MSPARTAMPRSSSPFTMAATGTPASVKVKTGTRAAEIVESPEHA